MIKIMILSPLFFFFFHSPIETNNLRNDENIIKKQSYNSLPTGSVPYKKYYGGNSTCNEDGCPRIRVKTSRSSTSDVIVTIKKGGKVVKHAYIKAGGTYTFSMPNGTYQTFFYYGRDWNPNKKMKGGQIIGGFNYNEDFGKDSPQDLYDNILTYELILQTNGNFSTRPSSASEAL